jgi:glycosyltransferase involved in cell wall biosynthesis
MLKGRDFVFISSIDWDFNWQGPQEFASRLAGAGNRVLFVENTGVRAPAPKDAGRVARRLGRWLGALSTRGLRPGGAGLYVHAPLVLPPFRGPFGSRLNARLLLPRVRRAALRLGVSDAVIVCYLPTDTAVELAEMLRTPRGLVVYYRVDNLALLTPHAERLRRSEEALIRSSDLVFANNERLAELPAQLGARVCIFPPSVDLKAFTPDDETPAPGGRAAGWGGAGGRAGPVIGYVGAVSEHLDRRLVTAAARLRPDWSWVFVGPCSAPLGELRRLPNVRFLGPQPHVELARFIRGFDVCIIPYKLSPYTATVVPTKLNEYLAVGKPVVSTDLPAVRDLKRGHDFVLISEGRPECFLDAIEEALRLPVDGAAVERRRAVAAASDWRARAEAMSGAIEAALEAKSAGEDEP